MKKRACLHPNVRGARHTLHSEFWRGQRASRCILSFGVVSERDWNSLQNLVTDAPPARCYFSDGFAPYAQLMYPTGSAYTQMCDKSQTYSVEGDNAELRHYLARLGRKSRCFSRCLWALTRAVALFVYAWNRRQRFKQQRFKRQHPKLPAPVCDFIADLCETLLTTSAS